MEFDDGLDDDGPTGPLLPPDDRLWRHPSELAAPGLVSSSRPRLAAPRGWTLVVLAGAMGALFATAVSQIAHHNTVRTVAVPAVERQAVPVTMASITGGVSAPLDIVAVVQRVRPAIVSLEAHRPSGSASGSGVLFRSDGFVLTDARLVAGATTLTAVLSDHRRVSARVLGVDEESGVAVVKLAGYGYSVAALGTIAGVSAGEPALVLGASSSNGDVDEVAVGTIRAVLQSVEDEGHQRVGMIESDARLGTEAVGGALLDANGVVIGIMSQAKASGAGSASLATPVDLAYAAGTELISEGKVVRPWLGIDGTDLDAAHAKAMGVPSGALIEDVTAASPAALAGLKPGDVITSMDGEHLASMGACMVALRTHRPGQRIVLHVRRGSEDIVMMATLAVSPAS